MSGSELSQRWPYLYTVNSTLLRPIRTQFCFLALQAWIAELSDTNRCKTMQRSSMRSMLDNIICSIYPCHILHMPTITHDIFRDKLTVLTTIDFHLLVPMNVWNPQFHCLRELIQVGHIVTFLCRTMRDRRDTVVNVTWMSNCMGTD